MLTLLITITNLQYSRPVTSRVMKYHYWNSQYQYCSVFLFWVFFYWYHQSAHDLEDWISCKWQTLFLQQTCSLSASFDINSNFSVEDIGEWYLVSLDWIAWTLLSSERLSVDWITLSTADRYCPYCHLPSHKEIQDIVKYQSSRQSNTKRHSLNGWVKMACCCCCTI